MPASNDADGRQEERRSEQRRIVDRYYSVEFKIKALFAVYQCKLRDVSSKGVCIVIKNDSPLLQQLEAGMVMQMNYYPLGGRWRPEALRTRIAHVTPQDRGRYRGHCLIGLEILGED